MCPDVTFAYAESANSTHQRQVAYGRRPVEAEVHLHSLMKLRRGADGDRRGGPGAREVFHQEQMLAGRDVVQAVVAVRVGDHRSPPARPKRSRQCRVERDP